MLATLLASALAKRARVNVETLRYYERFGLLPSPRRSASGYRLYDEAAVERVRFIKSAQQVGFSLREIRDLLNLRANPQAQCRDLAARGRAKLAELNERIRELQSMEENLRLLLRSCPGSRRLDDCMVISSLASPSRPESP
ncbi:MAG: heavy metal-responsive transcriptional regulator [Bryobacteraceae bacterium]